MGRKPVGIGARRAGGAILLGALLGLGIPPGTAEAQEAWTEFRSGHFTLYTTSDETEGRKLAAELERVREALRPALRWAGMKEKPVRIVAFASKSEMSAYSPNELADGFFLAGGAEDFMVMAAPYPEHLVAHEYGHLILSQNSVRLPPWLNEGIPEAYANFRMEGGVVVAGGFNAGRVKALATHPWVPLGELLEADYGSRLFTGAEYVRTTYAECWLLAHMLLFDERYAGRRAALLARSSRTMGREEVEEVYGKPLDEIERDLRGYLEAGERNVRSFELPAESAESPAALRSGAGCEARLTIAEMLRHYAGRAAQAREVYAGVERDFGDTPTVEWGECRARREYGGPF